MDTAVWTVYLCFWLGVLGAVLGSFFHCAAGRWAAGAPPFAGGSRCGSASRMRSGRGCSWWTCPSSTAPWLTCL